MLGRLGVVVNPDGSYYVPDYCSWWIPGVSYLQACKPPTQEEFMNDQRASLGPAAKANPALVKETEALWRKAFDMSCRSDPEQCAQYKCALDYPTLSATLGMSPVVCNAADLFLKDEFPWMLVAIGVGLILVLK